MPRTILGPWHLCWFAIFSNSPLQPHLRTQINPHAEGQSAQQQRSAHCTPHSWSQQLHHRERQPAQLGQQAGPAGLELINPLGDQHTAGPENQPDGHGTLWAEFRIQSA